MFYFRVAEVPTPLRAIYSRDMDLNPDEWESWWEEYLTLKYAALAHLNRHPRVHTKTVLTRLELSDDYTDVIAMWRALAPVERQVFRLRLDQIEDLATVQQTWYDDVSSFSDWASSCTQSSLGWDSPTPQIAGRDALSNLLAERAQSMCFEGDDAGKHVVELLEELRRVSIAHLAGAESEDVFLGASRDGALSVDPVAIILAQSLLALRTSGEMRLEKYIDTLITIVKTQFKARVVDFLLLRKERAREQLSLLCTTADISADKRRELEKQAAYTRPTGITGSVLVAQRHNARFHVGTNALPGDPRQSRWHREAFEEPYGEVENFWVFPIYVKSGFLGALRVVNHINDREEVVPWPYLVRRRLAGMLPSVAVFLDDCQHPSASTVTTGLPSMRVVDIRAKPLVARRSTIAEMITRETLPLDRGVLEELLDFFAGLAQLRIEGRWLALNTVIVDAERATNVREIIPESTFSPQTVPPSLAKWDMWSCKYPDIVIVVSMDGQLLGTLQVKHGVVEPSGLSNQRGVELALIQPSISPNVIQLWRRGERLGDYAYIPRSGLWWLREFARARDALSAKVPGFTRSLYEVFDHAIALSYAHGSLILFLAHADHAVSFPISDSGRRVGEAISIMTPEQFSAYATRDGAAVVSASGVVESAQETLPTDPPAQLKATMRKALAESRGLLLDSVRGKRHEGAMMASLLYPNSAVFCASEGRTVCVFVAGEAILWDF
jgi:hypothetical protein